MVKQKTYTHLDRNMNEYKMRTPYGTPRNNYQQHPSTYNQVEVTHSNGCCSSKNTKTSPSQPIVLQSQTPRTPRQTAHERSHSRFDPPEPVYRFKGRTNKNLNRTKKSNQQQTKIHSIGEKTYVQQPNNNYYPVQPTISTTTTTKKNNSCCTIL